jgi:signal transduction histidine kinase
MDNKKKISSYLLARMHQFVMRRWGGVGCRISFFIAVALLLVSFLVGFFFYWEGTAMLDAEIRGRALYAARELSSLTTDDIITENRHDIYKKLIPLFVPEDDEHTGSDLLYIMIYRHDGTLIIGSSATAAFFDSDSYFYTLPTGNKMMIDDVNLSPELKRATAPIFVFKRAGIYDLTVPVMAGRDRAGFIRVGVSSQRYTEKFSGLKKKAALTLTGIILVAMTFSHIITIGITKPIRQLSDAADMLSQQNWETPFPVHGNDEISRLGHAFNQMAMTLKQREASLSSWNRDLFILHTSGLDLMESLELETLVSKIAARADDLVQADTLTVSVLNNKSFALQYLGVHGSKKQLLLEQELPLEAGGIYNWLACYGTPLLISDARSDFRLDGERMKMLGVNTIMMVPLWQSNTLTGLLTVVNKKGGSSFDKHDLRLFTVFGNLAGAALQNASLYTDLREKMQELKSAQQQLIHSSKMAAIGELAANVAHEINNPLTSVLGYTTYLLKSIELAESPRRMLGMMEQETLRVRKIIRNLLDFSRKKPSWMKPSDLLMPIKETIALVQGMAESSFVRVVEEYPAAPVLVNMDHDEIKQVFINLAYNALQAMPSGGEFRVRLSMKQGNQAVVEFGDTGIGIAPENLDKIFEPFFSTKGNGDGTGLGLSISYRIIQNHGGTIEAASHVGQGTVFSVTLPLYQKTPLMAQSDSKKEETTA